MNRTKVKKELETFTLAHDQPAALFFVALFVNDGLWLIRRKTPVSRFEFVERRVD